MTSADVLVARSPRHTRGLRNGTAGFTLVEMLVATAILALIVVLISQLINSAATATLGAGKHIDSDTQARLALDRMASDLTASIKRSDVDFYFNKKDGNDELYFYSEVTGYYASGDPLGGDIAARNTVSLVGYRVNDVISKGRNFELERLSRGLHWSDMNGSSVAGNGPYTTMVYLPLTIAGSFQSAIDDPYNNSSNLAPANSVVSAPQWDVIGDQIFRFEYSFLLKNNALSSGGYSANSGKLTLLPYDSSTTPAHSSVDGLKDVAAIVVTFATLDSRSRILLPHSGANGPNLSALVDLFPDAVANENTADTWNKIISGHDSSHPFPPKGIPRAAAAGIRVYQRYLYLDSWNAQ